MSGKMMTGWRNKIAEIKSMLEKVERETADCERERKEVEPDLARMKRNNAALRGMFGVDTVDKCNDNDKESKE